MKANITIFDIIQINAKFNALEAVKINGKPYGKTIETTEAHYFILAEANTTVKQIKNLKCKELTEAYSGYTAALVGFAKAIASYKNHVEAKFSTVDFLPIAKAEAVEAAEAEVVAKAEDLKKNLLEKAESVKVEALAKAEAEKDETKKKKAIAKAEEDYKKTVEAAEKAFSEAVEAAAKAKSEAEAKITAEAVKAKAEAETEEKKAIANMVLEAFRNVLFIIGFTKKERVAVMFNALLPKDQRLNTFEAASTLVAIFAEVFTKTADNGNKKQETFSVVSIRSDGSENISNTVRNAFETKLCKLYTSNYTEVVNKTDFDLNAKALKAKINEAKAEAEKAKAEAAEKAEKEALAKAETEAKAEAEKEVSEATKIEKKKPETETKNNK